MLNQLVIVGRVNKIEKGLVVLSVPKSYKEEDGADIINIEIPKMMEENLKDMLRVDYLVGIKGRIATGNIVVADKLTFLQERMRNSYGNI